MSNRKTKLSVPKIHFVRGGVYVKANELIESEAGQRQLEKAKRLREFLEKRDRPENAPATA